MVILLLKYNLSGIDEIFVVLGITVVVICGLFVGMILKMEREHKRENAKKDLHKAGNPEDSIGQFYKSVYDVTPRPPTTPSQGEGV